MSKSEDGDYFSHASAAFDRMVEDQGRSVYEAAFFMTLYAATHVEHALGRESRERLMENIVSEMDRVSDQEASPTPSSPLAQNESVGDDESPHGKQLMSILQGLMDGVKSAGIPKTELPPALADYTAFITLALAADDGLRAIITRLEGKLDDYVNRRPPFHKQR